MPPPSPWVLAIDNGSQSTKVHIVDLDGEIVHSAQCHLRPYDTSNGHVVHPDDDVWTSIVSAVREVLDKAGGDARRITAVGLCTIRFCRALLTREGTLTEPLMSWMDPRVDEPYRGEDPDVRYVTTSSGYVTMRLTGERRDSAANQLGVWPLDLKSMDWSDTAIVDGGWRRDQLFELVQPGELLGHVTHEAAEETGLAEGLPVFATANDKAVESLGAGLTPGQTVLSLGTYIAGMALVDSLDTGGSTGWVNAASSPYRYLVESAGIRRGMWTVSWTRDLLLPPREAGLSPQEADTLLNEEAAEVAPGCGGLVTVLDWLPPGDEPFRRGAFLGFDGTQGRAQLYRSVLEAIACTMADNIEALEEATAPHEHQPLLVTGGGARSDLLMRILAATLDRPVCRPRFPDTAGLGAAICAAVGANLLPDWPTATSAMASPLESFTPVAELVSTYQEIRTYTRAVRAATADLYRSLPPNPSSSASIES